MASALGSDDPWEIAKSRFLEDLDDKERELFNSATLENLYYDTSNANLQDAKDSKTRTVIRKLSPLLSAVESYGKALDTFTNIAPQYLAPIWGSIRVVLVVAKAHGKYYNRIVDTLERIGDILPRFRDYERIYDRQKHGRLTQALSNTYLDIITICTKFRHSLRNQKSSALRRMLKPLALDNEIDEAITHFRRHRNNVDEEARTCHMIEDAEHRKAQIILWAAERRQRLFFRLSKVDCQARHRGLKQARHEGTGTWLTTRSEYQDWSKPGVTSVLCCFGIPGCGKSVLASSVIDSLSSAHAVLYYYCDYADKRTLEPTNVFGTLTRKCLEYTETFEPLAAEIEQAGHNGERLTEPSQALSLFQKSLLVVRRDFYIVIDGIDEASEASQKTICAGIRETLNNDSVNVHFFITGREDLNSLLLFKPAIHYRVIPMSESEIELDIASYVRASTQDRIQKGALVVKDPALEEVIVEELVKGAKGMFLWVEFQLNDLCEAESDNGIMLILKNLPRSLGETYDRLLGKIEGLERSQMIERMFKWIVCARRPLHVEELQEGIAFTLEDKEWDHNKIATNLGRLVRACGNLVVIDSETQVVQLSHYTVQQYLLRPGGNRFQFTLNDAENMAGEFCIAYLSFSNFETQVTKYKENVNTDAVALGKIAGTRLLVHPDNPGHIATKIWNTLHPYNKVTELNLTTYLPRSEKRVELSQFCFLSYVVDHWFWHTNFGVEDTRLEHPSSTARRDALHSNLLFHKQLLFNYRPWEICEPAKSKDNLIRILGWALMENQAYTIHLIDKNHGDYTSRDLLTEAWVKIIGNDDNLKTEQIPQLLLDELMPLCGLREDRKFLARSEPAWLCFVLFNTCKNGHIEALYAARLQDLNKSQTLKEYLVLAAVITGNLPVFRFLSQNSMDHSKGSIQITVPSTFNESLRRLESGEHSWSLNALGAAVIAGHYEFVVALCYPHFSYSHYDMLLYDSESYLKLLTSAAKNGKTDILKSLLFLRDNARSSFFSFLTNDTLDNSEMREALVAAVRGGHLESVNLLLNHGVDPDTKDSNDFSVLLLAIQNSDTSVVEMLLRRGCNQAATSSGMPLTVAAYLGNLEITRLLLEHGLNHNHYTSPQKVIESLAFFENSESFSYMYLSPTPLYVACLQGHLDVVKLLVSHGAVINFASPREMIELICSTETKRTYRCNKLVSSACGLDGQQKYYHPEEYELEWWRPILAAADSGHDDIVRYLLAHGAETNELREQKSISNPLTMARHENYEHKDAILSTILSRAENLSSGHYSLLTSIGIVVGPEIQGMPSLDWAIKNQHTDVLGNILYYSGGPIHRIQNAIADLISQDSIHQFLWLLAYLSKIFRYERIDCLAIGMGTKIYALNGILRDWRWPNIRFAITEALIKIRAHLDLEYQQSSDELDPEALLDRLRRSAEENREAQAVTVRRLCELLHYAAVYAKYNERYSLHQVMEAIAAISPSDRETWPFTDILNNLRPL